MSKTTQITIFDIFEAQKHKCTYGLVGDADKYIKDIECLITGYRFDCTGCPRSLITTGGLPKHEDYESTPKKYKDFFQEEHKRIERLLLDNEDYGFRFKNTCTI